MIAWHRPGQMVTMLNADPWTEDGVTPSTGCALPEFGGVYTIRRVYVGRFLDGTRDVCFLLEGVRNDPCPYEGGREPGFCHDAFRPVRPTSIDRLRELLVDPTARAPETVA